MRLHILCISVSTLLAASSHTVAQNKSKIKREPYRIDQVSHVVEVLKDWHGIGTGRRDVKAREATTIANYTKESLFDEADQGFSDTRILLSGEQVDKTVLKDDFVDVLGGLRSSTTALLNMSKHSQVQPGDFVALYRHADAPQNVRPLILVYCGEEPWPDKYNKKDPRTRTRRSFFIYPYYSWMEWNTFPPRQHRHLRRKLIDEESIWATLLYYLKAIFTDRPFARDSASLYSSVDQARQCKWLKTPISENYLGIFHDDVNWSNGDGKNKREFKYRVFRLKPRPSFLHLPKYMPNHRQLHGPSSCFFAAYANIATYSGKLSFGRSDRAAKTYERGLIKREVISPKTASQRNASWVFRNLLYQTQEANRGKTPPSPNFPRGKRWGAASLQDKSGNTMDKDFTNGDYLIWWFASAYLNRYYPNILSPVWKQDVTRNSADERQRLWQRMRAELQSGRPVLVALKYEDLESLDKVSFGYEEARFKLLPPNLVKPSWIPTNDIGHFVVVTGLRQRGNRRFVHFVEDGIRTYASFESFYKSVSESSFKITSAKLPPPGGWGAPVRWRSIATVFRVNRIIRVK